MSAPLETRYPSILQEWTRITSIEGQQLLKDQYTQELRQALSQVIKSFKPDATWKWHDQFKVGDIDMGQCGKEEGRGDGAGEENDSLLSKIMKIEEMKGIVGANSVLEFQVQEIMRNAIKVIYFYSFFNIS